MPAMQSHDYLTPLRGERLIKPKEYRDCVTSNIIDKQSTNHSKWFNTLQCNSEIYKNSLFSRTFIDLNHLDDNIVQADHDSVDGFRKAVHRWDKLFIPALPTYLPNYLPTYLPTHPSIHQLCTRHVRIQEFSSGRVQASCQKKALIKFFPLRIAVGEIASQELLSSWDAACSHL